RSPEADEQIQVLSADREWIGYGHLLAGNRELLGGKPQDALRHFRSVLPLLGHTRDVRAGLADAYLAVGQWDEARAELSGLVRMSAGNDATQGNGPVMGDLPHRALLLKLFESSAAVDDAD